MGEKAECSTDSDLGMCCDSNQNIAFEAVYRSLAAR